MSVKGGLSQSAHVGANVAMNRQWAPSGGSKISTLAVFFVTFNYLDCCARTRSICVFVFGKSVEQKDGDKLIPSRGTTKSL